MSPLLPSAVMASAAWAVLGLLVLRVKTRSHGSREIHAVPAGEAKAGVRYAFTRGMSPWAKESVREHWPSYGAGMAFHAGVVTALVLLGISLAGLALPETLRGVAQVPLALGLVGGLFLFLKRTFKTELRRLSHPDDFVSTLLSTVFVGLALAGSRVHAAWLLSALLLFAYVPLGKIRHCFFFFSARWHFGAFFGRRGVFPPGGSRVG